MFPEDAEDTDAEVALVARVTPRLEVTLHVLLHLRDTVITVTANLEEITVDFSSFFSTTKHFRHLFHVFG